MSVKQLQVWLKAFYESFWGKGLFTLREAKRYDANAKEWKKGIEVSCIDIDKYENGTLFYPEGWFPPPHEGSAMSLQPLLEWLQAFYSSLLPQALFEIEESSRYYDGPWPHGEDRRGWNVRQYQQDGHWEGNLFYPEGWFPPAVSSGEQMN
jgi:hypothetical protein